MFGISKEAKTLADVQPWQNRNFHVSPLGDCKLARHLAISGGEEWEALKLLLGLRRYCRYTPSRNDLIGDKKVSIGGETHCQRFRLV